MYKVDIKALLGFVTISKTAYFKEDEFLGFKVADVKTLATKIAEKFQVKGFQISITKIEK